jgi:hypothetical protein
LANNEQSLRLRIGEEIGWQVSNGNHAFRELLRQHQATTDGLVYFVVTHASSDIAEASAMVDFCAKAGSNCPLTIVIFSDSESGADMVRFADLRVGWLSEHLFYDWENKTELELWNNYALQRLIWESGGSPTIVALMEEACLNIDQRGRDELTIERVLSVCADNLYQIKRADLKALAAFFGDGKDIGSTSDQAELEAKSFASMGLLWRPRQGNDWILPGWVARSFVKENISINRWLLRRSLNCLSITGEVISACVSLELRLRQRYVSAINSSHLPSAAVDLYTAWKHADEREFVLYSVVAEPGRRVGNQISLAQDDAWAFASLGELQFGLKKTHADGRYSKNFLDAIDRLRNLRNSLAHAHPVNWNHIAALKKIASLL